MRIVVAHGLRTNAVSTREAVGKQTEDMKASSELPSHTGKAPLMATSWEPPSTGGSMEKPIHACGFVVAAPAGVAEGGANAEWWAQIVGESGGGFFEHSPRSAG